jgi:hypothetical protein
MRAHHEGGLCIEPLQYLEPGGVPGLFEEIGEGSAGARWAVVALGKFHEAVIGEITPRSLLTLVE